ncbi:MAG: molybdate ABC transporter substrate-binding protein [Paracoccaceae bacterium]
MLRLTFSILFVLTLTAVASANPIRVAVAANFRPAILELEPAFEKASGIEIEVSTGSTGQLTAQIAHGAPFHVLLAADQVSPAKLVQDELGVGTSVFTYATGRLALLTPGREVPGDGTVPDLGDLTRMSIANPRTAPYGVAAMEVLDSLDIAGIQLVLAQNAGGVVAAVASGAAPAGLTSLSLAKSAVRVPTWTVPLDLHEPLRQDAVLLTSAKDNPNAKAFLAWLKDARARRIIEAHGYVLD